MIGTEPTSAVVVRIPLPERLARLRRRWDLAAGVAVPPHVTILFPFMAPVRLDAAVRRDLRAIAMRFEPFEVRFDEVGRFPGVVYLVPEPSSTFADLTRALVARYPDILPYEGAFDEVVPHLTMAESNVAPLDDIAEAAGRELPFVRPIDAIEVIAERPDGRWRRRWRIPLGRSVS